MSKDQTTKCFFCKYEIPNDKQTPKRKIEERLVRMKRLDGEHPHADYGARRYELEWVLQLFKEKGC